MHGVMLMVELGDLREGIMPCDVHDAVARCLALPNIEVRGIGANLACRNGVAPDDRNMGELSSLAMSIEATVRHRALASSPRGNSANLEWLRSTEHVGRMDDLRLGESILLGRDPLHGVPVPGLHEDAAAIVAEVIESKYKPRRAWGDRAGRRSPLRWSRRPTTSGAAGNHCSGSGIRTRIRSTSPRHSGMRIIGASSDHLVIASTHRLRLGSEVAFRPGYSALVRAMSSRYVEPTIRGGHCRELPSG